MKKQEYFQAMHRIYRHIYSRHGDKDKYSFDEGMSLMHSFLEFFPESFGINNATFKVVLPAIIKRAELMVREGMSIDELLVSVSILALQQTRIVSRLFYLKILFWSMKGPLPLSPEEYEDARILMNGKNHLNVGDPVVVKQNVKDPDSGIDIGGWQGRISEIERDLVCIDWDSQTLKNMPSSIISDCEKEGLDWSKMHLGIHEIELTSPKDFEKDVILTLDRLESEHAWDYLGKEGRIIQEVIGVNPVDERAALKNWEKYLCQALIFPFVAKVTEIQQSDSVKVGDKVVVQNIAGFNNMVGIIVKIRFKNGIYNFPLCDLEVIDKKAKYSDIVRAYSIWFANR